MAKTRDDRIVQVNSNSVIIDGDAKDGAKAANIFSKSEQKTGQDVKLPNFTNISQEDAHLNADLK